VCYKINALRPNNSNSIVVVKVSNGKFFGQARREGGKGGKFFPAPRHLGAPPWFKNTENGVPDGFFLTYNMHKIHFSAGAQPRTPLGELTSYNAPRTHSRMVMGPLPMFPPSRRLWFLDLKTYRMGAGVIGPRDNVFPGPAVALDGPVFRQQQVIQCMEQKHGK